MIGHHHKIRPYRGPSAPLVEATRKADWIDVTFCSLRFGLPRNYVHEVATAFPLDGFYPRPAWPMVARYAVQRDVAGLPEAIATQSFDLRPGEAFDLRAGAVRKRIGDDTVKMLAYNYWRSRS